MLLTFEVVNINQGKGQSLFIVFSDMKSFTIELESLRKKIRSTNNFANVNKVFGGRKVKTGGDNFDETFGARPIKRAIQDKIEDLISEKILMMEIEENKEYFLKVENDEVIVTNKEEKPKTGRRRKNNE